MLVILVPSLQTSFCMNASNLYVDTQMYFANALWLHVRYYYNTYDAITAVRIKNNKDLPNQSCNKRYGTNHLLADRAL